jgi:hypothetical protein
MTTAETMNAADLINFLAALTIAADCTSLEDPRDTDRLDAEESVDFWWLVTPGSTCHLPDGRTLVRL